VNPDSNPLEKEIKAKNDLKLSYLVEVVKKKWCQLSSIDTIWQFTIYKLFYERFKEIGLLRLNVKTYAFCKFIKM
jgi:hypothetical protein